MRQLALGLVVIATSAVFAQSERPRARDLGLAPGVFAPGPLNAITDVAGVSVGHVTLNEGDTVRTGVTVVVPHAGNVFQDKVPGAVFIGNAFGKLAGSTQVEELGTIETPIALTNTLSVGAAMDGIVRWTLDQPGNQNVRSVNALVGETNDGGLNDIRGQHVRPQHVLAALKAASTGAVQEGSVGAGTGTQAFGWKGGIGTASRKLPATQGGYTLGVIVQSNYGGVLTMGGAPVGQLLGRYAYQPRPDKQPQEADDSAYGDGSCMIVVATDARSTRAISSGSLRAPSTVLRAPARRTATAAGILRSRSLRPLTCERGLGPRRRRPARCSPPTGSRPCSRRRSRQPKKRSTTPC